MAVNIIPILTLAIGVLIGASVAGVVAHTMNHFSDVDIVHERAILACYILALTIGIGAEYGRPLVVLVASYLGIVTIGKRIFGLFEHKLPSNIEIDD